MECGETSMPEIIKEAKEADLHESLAGKFPVAFAKPMSDFEGRAESELYRDLLYSLQEVGCQMRLLGISSVPEANKNRTHGSKGEELKGTGYTLAQILIDIVRFASKVGFHIDLDSIDSRDRKMLKDETKAGVMEWEPMGSDLLNDQVEKKQPGMIKWVDLGDSTEESEDEESEDQETKDEDLNLAVENCSDGEQFLKLCQIKTNDAGVSYVRMGDYVYVKKEENSEDGYSEEEGEGCPVCFDLDHNNNNCPWLVNVPPGKTVGRLYDIQCKGCDKLGLACCSKGVRAVLRRCGRCFDFGHWGDDCPSYKYMPLSAFPNYP
ncbi:putative transcription factor interactor and regulator CCHC(Zn) family [Rosa chinensis]|uniref:Putative transcription factor interactor and regulator CCHC(Zn) family n=1 Tax=Rosa chinensis TaxID=74649 RepID=A0A2P6SNB5_ROSCH|nr:uncharacterized protein LOC112181905 isoform X2 [Rosa chinensis]PRQ60204.1 putative transcription factor interactor and regulator CCHC(Zn) family [Rosa chinensis]